MNLACIIIGCIGWRLCRGGNIRLVSRLSHVVLDRVHMFPGNGLESGRGMDTGEFIRLKKENVVLMSSILKVGIDNSVCDVFLELLQQ